MTIDLAGVQHHPAITEITDVLCKRTQNTDRGFFHAMLAYFLGKMASCQRAMIVTNDRGEIPVNIYALALATSGYGKGHSVGIIENEFMIGFKKRFMEDTMPVIAEQHLNKIATDRANRNATDPNEEYEQVKGQYNGAGAFPFTFDSGTGPAVKQLRTKLILGNIGAINLQIDEIGSNLIGQEEILNVFLELYDQGMVKSKLTKNTAENKRSEEVDGKTPTNMLLFGTPSKLLNGGQEEDQFYTMLDTGYGRRCIFGNGQQAQKAYHSKTPAEIYYESIQPQNTAQVDKWANHFHKLADAARYGWKMTMDADVSIALLSYKIDCEKQAEAMPDHDEIRKAEMSHRYFKALKLAGAYAFVDESMEVEMEHLMQAILLVEESGKAFQSILNREKSYVKLAKYIANCQRPVTHADLHEALPFYKSGNAARNEQLTMATAWGYSNNVMIQKTFADGVEFFTGESLKETDLNAMRLSYSSHMAYNYENMEAPFAQLGELFLLADEKGGPMHWINHHVQAGHRAEESCIVGVNMIVLDIDEGIPLDVARELMAEYKHFIYTTKRHRTEGHGDRFRMVLPINYVLNLSQEDYSEMMSNIMHWLPFDIDAASQGRIHKWETNPKGQLFCNEDGKVLDITRFIPKTSRNTEHKASMTKLESLDSLERWFAERMGPGGRNNQMVKYAFALFDSGMTFEDASAAVLGFNKKLAQPLPDGELEQTVLKSLANKYQP